MSTETASPTAETALPATKTASPAPGTNAAADAKAERAHHPYSPSSLQNLEACPCYKSRDSQHARTIAGTIAHAVTETRDDDARLSDEDSLAAAECLDFYDCRRKAAIEGLLKGEQIEELVETYLAVDDLQFPDCKATTAGYVDRCLIAGSRTYAELFDWKFGQWPVEAPENNLQAISYVLGLFQLVPSLESIRFWFKQPLIDSLTDHVFHRHEIPFLYLRVQVVVYRARKAREGGDFSMAEPRVPVCNFCAHLGVCPKVAATMCRVAHKFHPLGIPDDITPGALLAPEGSKLGLELASVVTIWADAFKRQLNDQVLRGVAPVPPGYKLQSSRRRSLTDPAKFRAIALELLTPKQWENTLEIQFGAVEKAISDQAPRGSKKDAIMTFQARLVESGAVVYGEPFTFLRVAAPEKQKQETK